jgi:hypothetical protein
VFVASSSVTVSHRDCSVTLLMCIDFLHHVAGGTLSRFGLRRRAVGNPHLNFSVFKLFLSKMKTGTTRLRNVSHWVLHEGGHANPMPSIHGSWTLVWKIGFPASQPVTLPHQCGFMESHASLIYHKVDFQWSHKSAQLEETITDSDLHRILGYCRESSIS